MNRIVKIHRQKSRLDFVGDIDLLNSIANLIDERLTICVYGPSGVGKTHMVNVILNDAEVIHIQSMADLATLDSECHIVIDCPALPKDILDALETHEKLSKLSTIIISQTPQGPTKCEYIEVPKPSSDIMLKICKKGENFRSLAERCDGNIRDFINCTEFTFHKDNYFEPMEYVKDLFCKTRDRSPCDSLGSHVTDHGYMLGLVHENAIDSPLWDYKTADDIALADVYDTHVFKGNWDFMVYLALHGFTRPSSFLKHTLEPKLRPGSAWTTFNNYKMRHKKYVDGLNKRGLDRDRLHTIKELCRTKAEGHIEVAKSYSVIRQDFDVMNHFALVNKIKPRELSNLKKVCCP